MKRYLNFLSSIYKTPGGVIALTALNITLMTCMMVVFPLYWGWTGFILWLLLLVFLSIPLNLKLVDPKGTYPDPYDGRNYIDRR